MPNGAKLHVTKFEDMILRRGRKVLWREAIMCSCVDMTSGQPAYECKACNGFGYSYAPPIEDLALVMSVTNSKEFNDMAGIFEIGDAIMTVGAHVPEINPLTGNKVVNGVGRVNPIYQIGMYDLITLTDDDYKTSEVLVRGTPLWGRTANTLLNEDVLKITLVHKADPLTGIVTRYIEGEDFDLVENRIVWNDTSPNTPSVGEQYVVRYHHRPTFTVTSNLPSPRYQDGTPLPRKVALRYRGTVNNQYKEYE